MLFTENLSRTASPATCARHGVGELLLHPRPADAVRGVGDRAWAGRAALQPRVLHRAQGRGDADRPRLSRGLPCRVLARRARSWPTIPVAEDDAADDPVRGAADDARRVRSSSRSLAALTSGLLSRRPRSRGHRRRPGSVSPNTACTGCRRHRAPGAAERLRRVTTGSASTCGSSASWCRTGCRCPRRAPAAGGIAAADRQTTHLDRRRLRRRVRRALPPSPASLLWRRTRAGPAAPTSAGRSRDLQPRGGAIAGEPTSRR